LTDALIITDRHRNMTQRLRQ